MLALPIAVAAGALLEWLLRTRGFGDFPLFEPVAGASYRMQPNQAGRFRGRHAWRYDANGMRNDEAPASFGDTTLLLGDSIVDGGLRLDQRETLAALMTRHCGEPFYCICCHGWAMGNSLAALKALSGWSAAKRLVIFLNTGDLDSFNQMSGNLSMPRRYPGWLTGWLGARYLMRWWATVRHRRLKRGAVQPLAHLDRHVRAENIARFEEVLAEYPGPVYLVRYPMRGEQVGSERFFEQLASLDPRVRLVEAADAVGWSDACYVDHIHPNARGAEVLAAHLCKELS